MKKLILTILLAIPLGCFALDIPEDGDIRIDISDKNSEYYYPELMKRYLAADTTLTGDDYRHLYYGWAYQPGYEPLKTVSDNGLIQRFAMKESVTESDYEEIIRFLESSLGLDPFNMGYINLLSYVYAESGNIEKAFANKHRLDMIITTITSSGTGRTEKSPWQIISPTHAEDVMAYIGTPHREKQTVSIYGEYYPFYRKQNGVKGYFFDFRRIYLKEPENAGRRFDGEQGFEINGMKIR